MIKKIINGIVYLFERKRYSNGREVVRVYNPKENPVVPIEVHVIQTGPPHSGSPVEHAEVQHPEYVLYAHHFSI